MNLTNSWKNILNEEIEKEYFVSLQNFLNEEYKTQTIYPAKQDVFNALALVDFEKVNVVILGQDPYHEPNQAHGLAFSVLDGNKTPPSLKNIFKEIEQDLKIKTNLSPNLTRWAKQGVLLLNTTMTVRKGQANSHKNSSWSKFTGRIIEKLGQREKPIVFLLWGSNAISFKDKISKQHLVLTAPHPSPLSAYRGFLGCCHFSRCNEFLKNNNQNEIDWS